MNPIVPVVPDPPVVVIHPIPPNPSPAAAPPVIVPDPAKVEAEKHEKAKTDAKEKFNTATAKLDVAKTALELNKKDVETAKAIAGAAKASVQAKVVIRDGLKEKSATAVKNLEAAEQNVNVILPAKKLALKTSQEEKINQARELFKNVKRPADDVFEKSAEYKQIEKENNDQNEKFAKEKEQADLNVQNLKTTSKSLTNELDVAQKALNDAEELEKSQTDNVVKVNKRFENAQKEVDNCIKELATAQKELNTIERQKPLTLAEKEKAEKLEVAAKKTQEITEKLTEAKNQAAALRADYGNAILKAAADKEALAIKPDDDLLKLAANLSETLVKEKKAAAELKNDEVKSLEKQLETVTKDEKNLKLDLDRKYRHARFDAGNEIPVKEATGQFLKGRADDLIRGSDKTYTIHGKFKKEGNCIVTETYKNPNDANKPYICFKMEWQIEILGKDGKPSDKPELHRYTQVVKTSIPVPENSIFDPWALEDAQYMATLAVKNYRHVIKAAIDPQHQDYERIKGKAEKILTMTSFTFRLRGLEAEDRESPQPAARLGGPTFSAVVLDLGEKGWKFWEKKFVNRMDKTGYKVSVYTGDFSSRIKTEKEFDEDKEKDTSQTVTFAETARRQKFKFESTDENFKKYTILQKLEDINPSDDATKAEFGTLLEQANKEGIKTEDIAKRIRHKMYNPSGIKKNFWFLSVPDVRNPQEHLNDTDRLFHDPNNKDVPFAAAKGMCQGLAVDLDKLKDSYLDAKGDKDRQKMIIQEIQQKNTTIAWYEEALAQIDSDKVETKKVFDQLKYLETKLPEGKDKDKVVKEYTRIGEWLKKYEKTSSMDYLPSLDPAKRKRREVYDIINRGTAGQPISAGADDFKPI